MSIEFLLRSDLFSEIIWIKYKKEWSTGMNGWGMNN